MTRAAIYDAIDVERERQEAKFPNQHLPSAQVGGFPPRFISSAQQARRWTDASHQAGTLSWTDVFVEEAAEAVDAAEEGDLPGLRQELVQVIAVCVRWLEDLDR